MSHFDTISLILLYMRTAVLGFAIGGLLAAYSLDKQKKRIYGQGRTR